MGKIYKSIPKKLAAMLKETFDLKALIETGTFRNAWCSKWASGVFNHVYTVEGFQEFYDQAHERLKGCSNVTQFLGDSREVLPKMLALVDEPALLWLDAHWLGNVDTSRGTPGECPLREELRAVKASGMEHFILIDDAQYFNGGQPQKLTPGVWPQVDEIQNILGDGYYIVPDFEDVVIAVPAWARDVVDRFVFSPEIKVIVPTSNKYIGCLPAFAYLFNKFWSPKQDVTVIRYDVRPPELPGNFYCPSVGKQAELTWSQGLTTWLNSGYFYSGLLVLLLDDYFIDRPVDLERLKELYKFMYDHPEIGKIDLAAERMKAPHKGYDDGLVQSLDDADYQTSIQAAIWNRDFLIRYLQDNEGPWQFEKKGTKRLIAARKAGEEKRVVLGVRDPVISYVNAVGGEGTMPGKYALKRFSPELIVELRERRLM